MVHPKVNSKGIINWQAFKRGELCLTAIALIIFGISYKSSSGVSNPIWRLEIHSTNHHSSLNIDKKHSLKSSSASPNYFNLFMEGKFHQNFENVTIEPLEVMKLYIQQHSQATLEQELQQCPSCLQERSFLMAWYACPKDAGHHLHSLLNSLVWAITTNRTLLVSYLDVQQCLQYPDLWNSCHELSNQEDCDKNLLLQDWVPNHEWWHRYRSQNETIVRADPLISRDRWARPMDQPGSPKGIYIGANKGNLMTAIDLARPMQRAKLLSQSVNLDRVKLLMYYGYYFAYGMMLEALFSLHETDMKAHEEKEYSQGNPLTYVLHSQHLRLRPEAEYSELERICIGQLLGNNNDTCIVYIISDSMERIGRLQRQISDMGCIPKWQQADNISDDKMFFENLKFVRNHVRHGFLAPHRKKRQGIGIRPSSALIRESIEFRRVLEGQNSRLLHECTSQRDWKEGAYHNCTPIARLAASFGLERHQQLYGIIRDPCV
jgi:hypothetical protein